MSCVHPELRRERPAAVDRRCRSRLAAGLLAVAACTAAGAAPPTCSAATTVVLAARDDPYHDLAREFARAEGLPVAYTAPAALARNPVYLLWVTEPTRLSDAALHQLGVALASRRSAVSVGIISGASRQKVRDLLFRRANASGVHTSVSAAQGRITARVGLQARPAHQAT